jgi:GNAT superfamily N-acetyltransferase
MRTLREILEGLSRPIDNSADWIELVRDLEDPINIHPPEIEFTVRWADENDLLALVAMQGFVKEIELMERAFAKGDRCLLLEQLGSICAFAWVTFRDYRLSPWHTVHLPGGLVYLVYINVRVEHRHKGTGTYLLNLLMRSLREEGYRKLISGMYEDWETSTLFHIKSGFRICRKYTQRKILRFIPYPPLVTQYIE